MAKVLIRMRKGRCMKMIFSDPCELTLSLALSMTSLSLCKLFIMSTPICSEITMQIIHFISFILAGVRNLITPYIKMNFNKYQF